ncbi:response regulator [Myxococcus fulvus]|uniref:response regulator n=1 Tax=Myxococcus fulvus TaxID=33 RepID=UPI003B9D0A30
MALILLVDDDSTLLEIYTEALQGQGWEVASARDGEMALALAQALPPDLILTDVSMPGMNGLELCRHLRADETLRHVPRIVHSSMERLASLSGDVFLRKSGDLTELLACITRCLSHGALIPTMPAAAA